MKCLRGCLIFLLLGVAGSSHADSQGSVRGVVNFCGIGGVDSMRVYIPGRQYMVFTAADGLFLLERIPAGSFAIHFYYNNRVLHRLKDVEIQAGRQTELGLIAFCTNAAAAVRGPSTNLTVPAAAAPRVPNTSILCQGAGQGPDCIDADGDGVVAARDCDDHNKNIYPGAVEICDGRDNSCSGKVDDLGTILVGNGMGACRNGVVYITQCRDSFADCDGSVENGCETNISTDDLSCGACDNECGSTEICILSDCEG